MRFILVIITLIFSHTAFSQQQYLFQHINANEGLFSNSNLNVFQDSEGYYWFNSWQGIQRFDGKNFITYRYVYNKQKDFSDASPAKPIEDKEKNIWVWNNEGLLIFKRKERKFERVYLSDAPDSNTSNIYNVFKDPKGQMWIVTNSNIFLYDYSSHKPVFLQKIKEAFLHVVYDKTKNGFWMILQKTPHGFIYFDCNTKKFSCPINNSIDHLFGYFNPISLLKFDNDNYLWISDYLGDLCKYNINTQQATYYDVLHKRHWGTINLPNSAIFDFVDDGSAIWFSTDNHSGLLRYDKKTGGFSTIQNDNGSENGLHYQDKCNNMLFDNEGNIWVNTDMGINIFNPGRQQFKYINNDINSSGSPFKLDVTSFFESSKNEIWVSTWGSGIFRYDSNFNLLDNYIHRDNDASSLGEPLSKAWTIAEDKDGKIWVGCQYAMLSVLDPKTGKFNNKFIDEFNKRTIMFLVSDKQNNFWFGLHSGLLGKWDANSSKIRMIENLYGPNEQNIHPMGGMCVDRNDNLWFADGSDRLRYIDTKNDKIIETGAGAFHPLNISMFGDSLIIGGTSGNGLFVYNIFTKAIKFFTTENGLSSNMVSAALADNKNDIWIITTESIERLNLKTGAITKFGIEDGIEDHIFQSGFYKLKNGTMLVSANSGIIYFNPDSIKPIAPPPPATITSIRIAQKDLSVDSLLQAGDIDLAYDKNSIAIDYGSFLFSERKSIEYFYKLEGADKDWLNAGSQRSVMYANLASGKYQFKIKCQNRDGVSSPVTTLYFFIRPPWWQTWWAFLLWLMITAGIIYLIYDYRQSNRKQLSKMRQKIASDLHDDIGSTLNSISMYSEVAEQQMETNKENAKSLLKKMGSASRSMIDNMNDIVWAINPKNDQFENIIQRMQFFAGELLSAKNILLQFRADEKSKSVKLPMEKRKNFYLIFKEAVTNAYKYSSAKTVNVSISAEENSLVMIITDDGTGFDVSEKNKNGNGLKNMHTRSKEIGAALSIMSWPDKGTRVAFQMRIK